MTSGDIPDGYTVEVGLTGDWAETRHFLGSKSHFVLAIWIRIGKSLQELRVHLVFVLGLTTAKMPGVISQRSFPLISWQRADGSRQLLRLNQIMYRYVTTCKTARCLLLAGRLLYAEQPDCRTFFLGEQGCSHVQRASPDERCPGSLLNTSTNE